MKAFGNLAKTNNTLILSNDANNISSMVTQAMSIYKTIGSNQSIGSSGGSSDERPIGGKDRAEYYSDVEPEKP